MNLLIDVTKGYDALDPDDTIRNISGEMTFFPLCCSTGVLKNLQASKLVSAYKSHIDEMSPISTSDETLGTIKSADSIRDLIRLLPGGTTPIYFPTKVARWYAMSLIRIKVDSGRDDGPSGGYNNYKAAQVTFFDRLLEDKANPEFKFSYNTVYSNDHLMQWLSEQDGKYGEFYASPAVPGGHGARVRGCIFTPDLDAMRKYENDRIEQLRAHILDYIAYSKEQALTQPAADKVAAQW